jgi:deferrochelatase/peroxidase EfeB
MASKDADASLHQDRPKAGASRRTLMEGLGLTALLGGLARPALGEEQRQVADAPAVNPSLDERVPFFGVHQAGIVTPRPANGMIAAFDVIVESPEDLEHLFRRLTERIVFLTAGGAPPDLDPRLPPADSGILGPVIRPTP